MHYGEAIEPLLAQPAEVAQEDEPVVYAMADGLMLLVDEGYKETKLGRLFSAGQLKASPVADRGGHIDKSIYVGRVGSWSAFWQDWQAQLRSHQRAGKELVFLNDGVSWLHQKLQELYPDATQILDIYHVMEQLGKASELGISAIKDRQIWLDEAYNLLTSNNIDELLDRLGRLAIPPNVYRPVVGYIQTNRHRMDYQTYLAHGLCIGSGAIESANKAVVQQRMKRSGQRWSQQGAQRILNLRTCWMSQRWQLVKDLLTPESYAMAA